MIRAISSVAVFALASAEGDRPKFGSYYFKEVSEGRKINLIELQVTLVDEESLDLELWWKKHSGILDRNGRAFDCRGLKYHFNTEDNTVDVSTRQGCIDQLHVFLAPASKIFLLEDEIKLWWTPGTDKLHAEIGPMKEVGIDDDLVLIDGRYNKIPDGEFVQGVVPAPKKKTEAEPKKTEAEPKKKTEAEPKSDDEKKTTAADSTPADATPADAPPVESNPVVNNSNDQQPQQPQASSKNEQAQQANASGAAGLVAPAAVAMAVAYLAAIVL